MIYFIPYTILYVTPRFLPSFFILLSDNACVTRQIPGNIVLRILGARLHLTICVVGWGVAQLGMGFVKTWGELCVCRVLLGVFEVRFHQSTVGLR